MSDDKKVIDFQEWLAAKTGAGFWLQPWEYDDNALSFIDGEHPVVFVTTNEDKDASGICMSRETALKLRDALTGVLDSPHAPWNG